MKGIYFIGKHLFYVKAFILKSPFLWVFGPLLLKNEWLADVSVDFYSIFHTLCALIHGADLY